MARAGYDFVRWFTAAAGPFLAPRIAEWTDTRVPFVAAGAAAVCGAAIVRRAVLTVAAAGAAPVHAPRNGVAVFADRPGARARPAGRIPAPDPRGRGGPGDGETRGRSANSTMRCVTSRRAHGG